MFGFVPFVSADFAGTGSAVYASGDFREAPYSDAVCGPVQPGCGAVIFARQIYLSSSSSLIELSLAEKS